MFSIETRGNPEISGQTTIPTSEITFFSSGPELPSDFIFRKQKIGVFCNLKITRTLEKFRNITNRRIWHFTKGTDKELGILVILEVI